MKQNGIGTSNIFIMRNKVEMEYYFRKTLMYSKHWNLKKCLEFYDQLN